MENDAHDENSLPAQETTVSRSPNDSEKKTFPWVISLILAGLFIVFGFFSGTASTNQDMAWYRDLQAPPGLPSSWVFPAVWTALYALMGISLAILLASAGEKKGKLKALLIFVVQLALNLIWTPVFFGAQLKLPALVIILALLLTVFLTIRAFAPLSKLAAFLLVPYLLWVAYATYLNAGFVVLNL